MRPIFCRCPSFPFLARRHSELAFGSHPEMSGLAFSMARGLLNGLLFRLLLAASVRFVSALSPLPASSFFAGAWARFRPLALFLLSHLRQVAIFRAPLGVRALDSRAVAQRYQTRLYVCR
jgi:hypothetical protein